MEQHTSYRNSLAEQLKAEPDKEKRRQILALMRGAEEYQMANLKQRGRREAPIQEKFKQLFGHCFELSRLDNGDAIPVGGSLFSTEATIKVEGDFQNFEDFFHSVHIIAASYDLLQLQEWLSSQGIEMDGKLFATLFAFTKKFEQQYPINLAKSGLRRELYQGQKTIKLSDIFNANCAECAEVAALAQSYLQGEKIPSTYFSGDVLWNKDWEFSEEHSFIVIRHNDKIYIYDPSNPISTTSGSFPNIAAVSADFDAEVSKRRQCFLTAKNLISKREAYYGVNNGANILERNII